MKTLYIECQAGIAGDMTVAALLDMEICDKNTLFAMLDTLDIGKFTYKYEKTKRAGISAGYFEVDAEEQHAHRHLSHITEIINNADMSQNAKNIAIKIFDILAQAESKAHGTTTEKVHFHEVGAVDSIVDILSTAFFIDKIKPDKIIFSPLYEGSGTVRCQHGTIPVPVPAVLNICETHNISMMITANKGEQITPTGAAIAAALADEFGSISGKIIASGYGAGKRNSEHANVVRAMIFEDEASDTVTEIITAIDDSTGEELGFLTELLLNIGALDAYYTSVYMKKGRPGVELTVLVKTDPEPFIKAIFKHSGAIGVRIRETKRIVMDRKTIKKQTQYGEVFVKESSYKDIKKNKIEYQDIKKIALEHDISIKNVEI